MSRAHIGPYTCIYRETWNNEKFLNLSDDSKLVLFHIMTTSHGTQFGFFKIGVAGLADEIDWDVKRYEEAVKEIIDNGYVEHDPNKKTWLIPGYVYRNPPNSPTVVKSWGTAWRNLPNSPLRIRCKEIIRRVLKELRPNMLSVFTTSFVDDDEVKREVKREVKPLLSSEVSDELSSELSSEVKGGKCPPGKVNKNNTFELSSELSSEVSYEGVGGASEQYSGSGSESGSEEPTVLAPVRDLKTNSQKKYEYDGGVENLSQQIVAYAVDRFGDWPQSEIEPSVMKLRSEYPKLTMPSWSLAIDEAYREAPPGARPYKYHEILYRKVKWVIAKNANQSAERATGGPSQSSFWLPGGMSRPRGEKTALGCLARHREEKNYPSEKLDQWEKEIKARGE